MWTPKRVLILLGSFVFFATLFGFYFHFLGYLDGLPELPKEFWPDTTAVSPPTPPPTHNDKIFQDAFGDDCEELLRPIRLFLRTKGLAFATKSFEIGEDKRVKLTPFSAVIYGKSGNGAFPEINTVRSEYAFLTLDKPIASLSELGARKITAVELKSSTGIKIKNNRRTSPTSSDHITVDITNDSLYYEDSRNLIWTNGLVTMLDGKTSPPTQITATGMDIHLIREGTTSKGTSSSGKGDNISGVERVVLKSHVHMQLYMDPQSGFLANPQGDADKGARKKNTPAEKSHVTITTDGPFDYDFSQERAHFRCDPNSAAEKEVIVRRKHQIPAKSTGPRGAKPGTEFDVAWDEISCEDLVLFFRKKTSSPGGKGGDQGTEKEIETALATGKEVHVAMHAEDLKAWGTEMFYRSASDTTGPQTTIKGQPMMRASKDGHEITAPELHLVGGDKKGFGQLAEAHGAGRIDMKDSAHPKPTQHAVWRDEMSFVKVTKNGVLMDLLTLKGEAGFEDDERQQALRAQELSVWLEPSGPAPEPATGPRKSEAPSKNPAQGPLGSSSQKLHRLEAHREVTYFGPDVHIERCEFLVINARDKEKSHTIPTNAGGPPPAPLAGPTDPVYDRMNGTTQPNPVPMGTEPPQLKKARPIRLWARDVRVNVLRVGSQNEMDNLIAEEDVHVVQEGETPTDKGVDIQGHMLNLVQHEQGKILYVDGDEKATGEKKYGRLMMNDMLLVGPKISINQKDNIAQAEGQGYLNMPSNSNLDGTKSTNPAARMTVHWNRRMEFDGSNANFYGGVQAVQDNSNLRCQELQVTMDHPISFKEGQKDTQAAKIDKIVCVRDVFIFERVIEGLTGKLLRQQAGQFGELTVDNLDGATRGSGPGFVASFSKDGGDPKNPKGNNKQSEQTKLTRVEFRGWLWSKSKDNTRRSKFYDYVEVFHLPAARPDVVIDRTKPPKDGFYLQCGILEIFARPVNGKSAQYMEATKQVTFQTDEFFGRADLVKFDEADDIIVFEAMRGSMVVITKMLPGGAEGQRLSGTKILYNRKTGAFDVDGGRQFSGRG